MINLPLPMTLEEVTTDWLAAALRAHDPAIELRDSELVGEIRGTCTKLRYRLDMNDAGAKAGVSPSVIVKTGFEPHSAEMWAMHKAEIVSYRDVLPQLGLVMPKCYFADFDEERRHGMLIIEDLATRGVTFCHAQVPQSFEQAKRRLTAHAELHAKSWDSPEFAAGGKLAMVRDSSKASWDHFDPLLVPDNWQSFIDKPRGAAVSVQFHDLEWMRASVRKLADYIQTLPLCATHGDSHPGNLYIEPDGTPGFYDCNSGRSPGIAEATYFLVCGLDTADRARWEGALIQHYLNELGRFGVKDPPSFDEAMRQYAIFLLRAYLIFILNDSVFQPEAINTAYTARISAAMIDHRTKELMAAL